VAWKKQGAAMALLHCSNIFQQRCTVKERPFFSVESDIFRAILFGGSPGLLRGNE
jgi:hypothetical protein